MWRRKINFLPRPSQKVCAFVLSRGGWKKVLVRNWPSRTLHGMTRGTEIGSVTLQNSHLLTSTEFPSFVLHFRGISMLGSLHNVRQYMEHFSTATRNATFLWLVCSNDPTLAKLFRVENRQMKRGVQLLRCNSVGQVRRSISRSLTACILFSPLRVSSPQTWVQSPRRNFKF